MSRSYSLMQRSITEIVLQIEVSAASEERVDSVRATMPRSQVQGSPFVKRVFHVRVGAAFEKRPNNVRVTISGN